MIKIFKEDKGIVITDAIISIIAILAFSSIILSAMYSNKVENAKNKMNALTTIYFTEIFENIAIANYDEVNMDNISNIIPEDLQSIDNANIEICIDQIR